MRGQRNAPAAPYPRERPGTHCTGGWVGLRAGLDWCGKYRPTGIRSPDRPARRQSLYRLHYPAYGSKIKVDIIKVITISDYRERRNDIIHYHVLTPLHVEPTKT